MRFEVVAVLLTIIVSHAYGVTYYFANSGADTNNCTTDAPCSSIDKFNALVTAHPLKPGDSTFFKTGDVFRGQVKSLNWVQGTSNAAITFGSYGDPHAAQPILSGTTVVTGWSKSNGLFTTKVSNFNTIENIFIDGVKQSWGRTPNLDNPPETRYLNITASGGSMLQTNNIKDPSGTWNGATVRVRIYLWSVTTRIVASHTFDGTTATFTLTQPFENGYQPGVGWKFLLENKVAALDRPGEWAFDPSTSILSLYPLTQSWDPSKSLIEASVYQQAFDFVISNYITFINLHFRGQIETAIKWDGSGVTSNFINILNCTFSDQEQSGVEMSAASDIIIANSTFMGMQNAAININAERVTVVGNNITWVGMAQGHQNKGGGVGIGVTGAFNVFTYNHITHMSYNGIVFSNSNTAKILNNYVSDCTLTLSDGGGIYTFGQASTGSIVQNNIVTNIRSLPWDGFWPVNDNPISNGIYIDNYCSGITIMDNTVAYVDGAPLFANSGNHKWLNNLLVGGGAEGSIGVEEMPGNSVVQNMYSGNTVYIRSALDVGAIKETSNVHQNTTQMATYTNNIYCNPYGSLFFTWNNAGYAGGRGWESWLEEGRDKGSSLCKIQSDSNFQEIGKVASVVAVINKNPTFAKDASSWSCDKCTTTWEASSPVGNTGSVRINVASHTGMQFQQGGLTCKQGANYRFRFAAYATKETVLWTGLMMSHAPWSNPAGNSLVFVIPSNKVQNFDEVFESTFTDSCMINLSGTMDASTSLYITDMYVEEVTVQPQIWDYVAVNPSSATAKIVIPPTVTFTDINERNLYICAISLPPWSSQLLVYHSPNDPSKCKSHNL